MLTKLLITETLIRNSDIPSDSPTTQANNSADVLKDKNEPTRDFHSGISRVSDVGRQAFLIAQTQLGKV
jgi:hypothetical protein